MNDPKANIARFRAALAQLPSGLFVISGQFEGKRAGVVIQSVMLCATDPPLVCVSMRKGHWVSPLIRDSHCFGLSRIAAADKLALRKFHDTQRPKDGDPFDCMPLEKLVTGVPLLARAKITIDCEVSRHLDLEADFELFIGRVLDVRVAPELLSLPAPSLDDIING